MPDPTPPTCARCGIPLPNDAYGTRCEDCWVETSAECYQPLSSAVRLDRTTWICRN